MTGRLLLAALGLGWGGVASAVVNIEDMRPGEPAEGLSGRVHVAVGGSSGSVDKIAANADGRVQWHRADDTYFATASYAYGESRGLRDANAAFLHLRHIHRLDKLRSRELFAQWESNEFARLSSRALLGTGLRFALQNEPGRRSTHLGTGAFYSVEQLDDHAGYTDHGRHEYWRFNFYLSHKHRLNEQMQLASTTYYQPAIGAIADYRLLEQAALNIKMTERLSLELSLNILHDNRPPQGVEKTETQYSTGIEYRF